MPSDEITFFRGAEPMHGCSVADVIRHIRADPGGAYFKQVNQVKTRIDPRFAHCQFICHRVNDREALSHIDPLFGVEVDVRDHIKNNDLVLVHDPFQPGESFSSWLTDFHHATLILNIKSERTELRCVDMMRRHHITNYFFLDSSVPMIVTLDRLFRQQPVPVATRFSEIEPIESVRALRSMTQWVWMDCFTRTPIETREQVDDLCRLERKTCWVSPELHGRWEDISSHRAHLLQLDFVPDAICCKHDAIALWL